MIRDVEQKKIRAIVCYKLDRISRRMADLTNLIELAKDGRWMGGITPTGYTVERTKYGSGKKKNAFTYLMAIPEEKALVQHIYATFLATRSINATANRLNEKSYRTKNGAEFTVRAVKDSRGPGNRGADQRRNRADLCDPERQRGNLPHLYQRLPARKLRRVFRRKNDGKWRRNPV